MVLELPEADQIFPHSRRFNQGGGKIRPGSESSVVAKDGSGDFSDIQEAIDELPIEGGNIFIKEGTFELNNTILINKSNVRIYSGGSGAIIKRRADTAIDIFTLGDGITERTNIIIDGIQIDDIAGASGSDAIEIKKCSQVRIQNCYFKNVKDFVINDDANCSEIWIINNFFESTSGEIDIGGNKYLLMNNISLGGLWAISGNDHIIQGNYIDHAAGNGTTITGSRNRIINNTLTNFDTGETLFILAGATDTSVLGNMVDDEIDDAGTTTDCSHNIIF